MRDALTREGTSFHGYYIYFRGFRRNPSKCAFTLDCSYSFIVAGLDSCKAVHLDSGMVAYYWRMRFQVFIDKHFDVLGKFGA